jgi:hypothetical protein
VIGTVVVNDNDVDFIHRHHRGELSEPLTSVGLWLMLKRRTNFILLW